MMQCDAKMSYVCFSQLTVVGQTGVLGIPVMRPVELVIKSVSETAHVIILYRIVMKEHTLSYCDQIKFDVAIIKPETPE